MSQLRTGVLIDLDGTLVDSVYHHVIAWSFAFRTRGYQVPLVDIHRAIGMGSDRLIPWLLGESVSDAEALSEEHTARFLDHADALTPTSGAQALLRDLEQRGVDHVVASSASGQEAAALLKALGLDPPLIDSDAVAASKPAPDLLLAGCAELGTEPQYTMLIGDSPWDADAARRIGVATVGVRCGGFSDEVLRSHGVNDVVSDPRALVGRL